MKLVAVCCLSLIASSAGASFRAKSDTASPVERVVKLLQKLAAQIETDKKSETEIYNKYACWCEKTVTRKAANIDDGYAEMRALSQKILILKGTVATLKSEIAKLAAEIKQNEEDQADATNIRSKQNAAFMTEAEEMKEALSALQSAIKVLADATLPGKSALVQEGAQAQSRMAVRAVLSVLPSRVSLPVSRLSMLGEFASGSSKYAPQSASIQGILVDMYSTFASDLESSTQTEATQNRDFEKYIAVKTEEKATLEKTKLGKETDLSAAEADLAEAVQTFDATFAQKAADIKFFDETKKACTSKWEEWSTRSTLREEELKGIEKAIEILTADDARDTFRVAIKAGKETGADASIPTSFVQFSKGLSENAPVVKAYNALKAQASNSHSLRLAALAVQVRTAKVGHFEAVIKAIDDMMATLKSEAAADLSKKTTCINEYQQIELALSKLTWDISVNDATIDKLMSKIELLTKEKEKTIAEIKETDEHLAAILKQRTEEHDAFTQAKAEDQEAISLLTEARTALMAYYKKNGIALGPIQGEMKGLSLMSRDPVFEVSEDQAPDATFSSKGSRKGESKDIVSLMTYLIQDLEDEVRNGISTEEAQQTAYEEEKATAEDLKKALISKKNDLSAAIARAGKEKGAEEEKKSMNQEEFMAETGYEKDIKPDCDWIIGAFDKRAEARAAEMKGLTEAKEYLAGYQGSLLEKTAKVFDDNTLGSIRFLSVKH